MWCKTTYNNGTILRMSKKERQLREATLPVHMPPKSFFYATIREAGRRLKNGFDKEKTIHWKHRDVQDEIVTNVDKEIHDFIVGVIGKQYPDHKIISEEGDVVGKSTSDFVWFIDPLDGTSNFARHIAFFCVSMTLCHKGKVMVSCVYDPIAKELFYAEKGHGALMNDMPVTVRQGKSFRHSFVAFENIKSTRLDIRPLLRKIFYKAWWISTRQSVILTSCYVACGRFDAYVANVNRPWDMAPGYLLITEAGGRYTDIDGKPYVVTERVNGLIAGSKNIHKNILRLSQDEADSSLPKRVWGVDRKK